MNVKYKLVENGTAPTRATDGSAGLDLYARADGKLWPNWSRPVPVGVCISVPVGYAGLVVPRSGLAVNYKVTVLNSPGVIDSDYTGEIHAVMVNYGDAIWNYRAGDRIAQLVIVPFLRVELEPVAELSETSRGDGGFGSTGSR